MANYARRTPDPWRATLVAVTVRDRIRTTLEQGPHTALQISQRAGVAEAEVAAHLQHLARSLSHRDQQLIVEPAGCLSCGFSFDNRRRLSRPSRCPECRSERLTPPRFSIEPL